MEGLHPVIKFYIMRYKEGKTTIPAQWEKQVLEELKKEKLNQD